jgi:hypothetical protein
MTQPATRGAMAGLKGTKPGLSLRAMPLPPYRRTSRACAYIKVHSHYCMLTVLSSFRCACSNVSANRTPEKEQHKITGKMSLLDRCINQSQSLASGHA